jgi:hypothetical protein
VLVAAPSSGAALTVQGVAGAGNYAARINGANTGTSLGLQINAGNSSTDIALEVCSSLGGANPNFIVVWGDGHQEYGPAVGSGTAGLVINTFGAVTVFAPSSGHAMSAFGAGTIQAAFCATSGAFFQASSSSGTVGLAMNSVGADFGNVGNLSSQLWQLGYANNVNAIGTAALTWNASGNVQIQDGNGSMFDAGFRAVPFKQLATGAYTPILSDSGKYLDCVNGTAVTMPTNAAVPYPLGTVITFLGDFGAGSATIAAGAGETLFLAPTTGTTGTRTLNPLAVACLLRISISQWVMTGVGIT